MESGRFTPPVLRQDQYLFRKDLVYFGRSVLQETGRLAAVAPAGQGKTTFAAQIANADPVIWLSCDSEDADPSVLATDLLLATHATLRDWQDEGLRTRAQRAELMLQGPEKFALSYYAALTRHTPDILIVLDDLHLAAHAASQPLLEAMAAQRPRHIRLLWLSRTLPEPLAAGLDAGDFPRLSMDRLSMAQSEIHRLYKNVYGIPITPETAEHIFKTTRGWAMAVASARQRVKGSPFLREEIFRDTDLQRFFHDTFLGRLTGLRRSFVLCLSALERIPLAMVEELAPDNEFPAIFQELGEEGLLLQQTGTDTCAFHHLIRDFLQNKRDLEEPLGIRRSFFAAMARWHEEKGLLTEALRCFTLTGDGEGAERLMDTCFQRFMELRQDARIASHLAAFETSEEYPTLALALAFFSMAESPPETTARLLHTSEKGFADKEHPTGELRTLILMIRKRLFGDPLYDHPDKLFLRMKELLRHPDLCLSEVDHLLVALGWGQFAILHAFSRKMVQEKVAPVLDRKLPASLVSIEAELTAILTHGEAMTGRHRTALDISERGHALLADPGISTWSAFSLRFARANTLGLCGMEAAFARESSHILRMPPPLLEQTLAVPFIRIREISFLVQKGLYDQAEALAAVRLQDPRMAGQASLGGEFLQYRAWALALGGKKEEALRVAALSEKAQTEGGNAFFQMMNLLMTGTVSVLCGREEDALGRLHRILKQRLVPEEVCLREGAFWMLSLLHLRKGRKDKACLHLEEALKLSEIRNAPHFIFTPCWLPELLELAMEQGILRQRTAILAKEVLGMAFDAKNKAAPLMKIRLMGSFTLCYGEKCMTASDFSPLHRSLLGLLILAPGHSVAVSTIQEKLWPHVMAESARTSLDTALLRLRKLLSEKLGKAAVSSLVLSNGILSLSPLDVDAFAFLEEVDAAEKSRSSGYPWMAEAHAAQAAALDRGDYSGEILGIEGAAILGKRIAAARRILMDCT
ncbi:hypothetical protein [Desulfobotulus alkaliphilus]|nr:hypothetical protein [Desulfobotulus alkaliphilus]